MTLQDRLRFADSLTDNLRSCILPYWMERMLDTAGGFYGRRDGNDRLDDTAPRGAILNARILWTFSAAYNALGRPEYLGTAMAAFDYITSRFIDQEHGGVYWSLRPDGCPLDTKKQFYAIAFTIYGMAEFYRASGNAEALRVAMNLFDCIEAHSLDTARGGYREATTRDWQPIEDMRLSEQDANTSKTMNTHLHIIEAYSALLSVTGDARVAEATRRLLDIFLDRIYVERTGHLGLFFDDDWQLLDDTYSYGHDIEASWLLVETARAVGDDALLRRTMDMCRRLAERALDGLQPDGSLIYEREADGRLDRERHWWVQAECVVGQLYLALFHGLSEYYDGARATWQYCLDNLVDSEGGEWYWSRLEDGSVNRRDDKAGFWKCPYHNSRACLEGARILRV